MVCDGEPSNSSSIGGGGGGGGYLAVHAIDPAKLDQRDLDLTGLSELSSEAWRKEVLEAVVAPALTTPPPEQTTTIAVAAAAAGGGGGAGGGAAATTAGGQTDGRTADAAATAAAASTIAAAAAAAAAAPKPKPPSIIAKLRKFCERYPCNGQLRVVSGTGAKPPLERRPMAVENEATAVENGATIRQQLQELQLPPYATDTLQIEPPPTAG